MGMRRFSESRGLIRYRTSVILWEMTGNTLIAHSGSVISYMHVTAFELRGKNNEKRLPRGSLFSQIYGKLHRVSYAFSVWLQSCTMWPSRNFSHSSAAMQPLPAAVIAWRYLLSCTSPQANTPGTFVMVVPGVT
ncbi:hypothetical protein PM3016_6627 [Paenibacillus mucilaginosus 3016]|uniref:Uncharacterized protein n=1 Tax=Paenibacillus mucilaginosus 3016 TaxID=1116391 RepID=H6NM80_9BACL|nr:hypothetical protein PM3016_6627 [Paenibacillus mucilaginosus 3016]